MMFSVAWAQDATAAAPGGDLNAMLMSALPFILVFAVFYFVLMRPQMQAAKKHTELLSELKKGDVIVTDGGLVGEVANVMATLVHVRLAEDVVVTVAKEAVRSTVTGDAAKGWEAKATANAVVKKR